MIKDVRKTRIVCTIGPASESARTIERLVRAGMNAARLNFSHGTRQWHRETLEKIRAASEKLSRPVAVIQDLAGPKIRVGNLPGPVKLKIGQKVVLAAGRKSGRDAIPLNYARLARDVRKGDAILLADGSIELKVTGVEGRDVHCRVVAGGSLSSGKGVNVPAGALSIQALTKKDRQDLEFAVKNDVDFLAMSFVGSASDVKKLKKTLAERGSALPVIAKIERPQALDDFENILTAADAVMVARGDLGVEIPLERVPVVQKELIRGANARGKPVITATQMLRSMEHSPRPTRAEVADVANAIWDGTDAVMLSEETATGAYPVEAVKVVDRIARMVENDMAQNAPRKDRYKGDNGIPDAISYSAYIMAEDMDTRAIISPTRSGATARRISRYRPAPPIVALTPSVKTMRELCLTWGVVPVLAQEIEEDGDLSELALEWAGRNLRMKKRQKLIITSGASYRTGTTNTIRMEEF